MAPGTAMTTGANVTVDPIARAENVGSIKRMPDEAKLTPSTVQILIPTAAVRTQPFGDKRVIDLPFGASATKVARVREYYLVTFDDPNVRGRRLAGWLHQDAIDSRAVHSPEQMAKLGCRQGEVQLETFGELCATPCNNDADCKAASGGVCDGYGKRIDRARTFTGYCVSNE